MSISIFNSEHYSDPTAFNAIAAVVREEQGLSPSNQPQRSITVQYIFENGGKSMNSNIDMKTPNQHIRLIALNKCVPAKYQRITSDQQVEEIISRFDEARLGVLTVSLRDGNIHIVDGLHRSLVLKELGYTHAYAVVLTGMTYEQEAAYFRRQNENRRNIVTFDDFKAGIEAKDETCLRIDAIVRANGFQIGRGNSFYQIASIQALFTIVKDFGYETLSDTLSLLAKTWSSIAKASQCECLLGVAEFVHRYGMAEFAERMKSEFAVVIYEYTEAMRMHGSVGSSTSRKRFCRALVFHYNKGLRSNNKRRLVWED